MTLYTDDNPVPKLPPREDLDEDWTEAVVDNSKVWKLYEPSGMARTHDGMNPEVLAWLETNVGARARMNCIGEWRMSIPITDLKTYFFFKDRNHALMFKLKWG